jgi:hypothetical protein
VPEDLLAATLRYAMVFSHPAHELPALGLIQHCRPDLLFLTRADSAGEEEREGFARQGLGRLDLLEKVTFFGIPEAEIHRWLLQGDASALLELRARILAWLTLHRPDAVFGDAFELTNVVHDLARATLDSALRAYTLTHPCRNFELPLACRTAPELWSFHFQEFPGETPHAFLLDESQMRLKKEVADWMGTKFKEAAVGAQVFPLEREVYREVPAERDYTVPPAGLMLHYDEWGRAQVARGKYREPILFASHFVPLVRQLP